MEWDDDNGEYRLVLILQRLTSSAPEHGVHSNFQWRQCAVYFSESIRAVGAERTEYGGRRAPSTTNDFGGSITLDGQALWVNRGSTVENWGIEAPDEALVVSTFGASAGSWSPNTYYSPASIVQDSAGYLWQVFKAGYDRRGFLRRFFPSTPTPAPKFDIYAVTLNGVVGGFDSVTFSVEPLLALVH